jgi:hypothetical protein
MKKLFIIALSFFMFACSEEEDSCTPTPTLITNEPSAITDTAVTFSGTIEAPTCDPTVTSQGVVYSRNTLPKVTDFYIELIGKDINTRITNLLQNTTYYCRTYFTNPTGTYYSNEISFKTNFGAAIGDYVEGGIVFYLSSNPEITDLNGDGKPNQGLVVSTIDIGRVQKRCNITNSGANGTSIGTGYKNTQSIIDHCDSKETAAHFCNSYSITTNNKIYSDWFLPSKDELNEIYINKTKINESLIINGKTPLKSYFYWNSTYGFETQSFSEEYQAGNESSLFDIRAVRAF